MSAVVWRCGADSVPEVTVWRDDSVSEMTVWGE